MSPWEITILTLLLILIILAFVWAIWWEPWWIDVTKTSIFCKGLPKDMEGLRLAFISDIHAGGWNSPDFYAKAVKIIKDNKADMLLIGGDIVATENSVGWQEQMAAFANLSLPLGKFAVAGGHDHRFGIDSVREGLASLGIRLLTNETVQLVKDSGSVFLMGLDDNSEYPVKTNVTKAAENVPSGAFTIVMVHSPDFIYLGKKLGLPLVLSGHTHGGQVRLPIVGSIVKVTELPRKYDHSLSKMDNSQLYITRGLGSTVRLRFFCRPEISIITLKNKIY